MVAYQDFWIQVELPQKGQQTECIFFNLLQVSRVQVVRIKGEIAGVMFVYNGGMMMREGKAAPDVGFEPGMLQGEQAVFFLNKWKEYLERSGTLQGSMPEAEWKDSKIVVPSQFSSDVVVPGNFRPEQKID